MPAPISYLAHAAEADRMAAISTDDVAAEYVKLAAEWRSLDALTVLAEAHRAKKSGIM